MLAFRRLRETTCRKSGRRRSVATRKSVSLVVEALAVNGEKCPLRFTIEDTGIGIGKDFLPRMFEAFALEDESYTSKHGSTGLGLSITKSIVELIDGRIAVEMFKSHEPGYYSAILMDVRMPEMDGLEATRVIRSMDREDAKSIPIIALTANAFDEDVQNSLQAGLNAHLSKPVEPETVFRTLEELL